MATWRIINWILQKPEFDDIPVWVCVHKLEQSWQYLNGEYIGFGGTGRAIAGRYERIGIMLRSTPDMWMPAICLDSNGSPNFTDGRHRFAWIRDHKVQTLPVAVPPEQLEEFALRFGVAEQVSKWFDENE